MKILFLDIETVPTPQALLENGLQDTQLSLNEPEIIKRLSLAAVTARILCLGYVVDPPREAPVEILYGEESEIIRGFWKLATEANLFVGHNVLDFDLRFIYQRSVINRIKPSREIPFARFRNAPIFDTMHEWSKWGRDLVKLDVLAKSLDLPSPKTDLDGSKVFGYYRAGREAEIHDYCKRDVDAVRKIYRRLTFSA
ncbi:MAG: ribonuclease H-like domain-containing protein [Candidatus Binatia bacterium]